MPSPLEPSSGQVAITWAERRPPPTACDQLFDVHGLPRRAAARRPASAIASSTRPVPTKLQCKLTRLPFVDRG